MSDFSLMDAIECGIVKLPRVPVAQNIPGDEMPMFRNLWEHIGKKMPKKGRGQSKALDPLSIPVELQTALEALYGHYDKTFQLWQQSGITVPPCFIVVCNNTSTSKLVYDYISGFQRENEDGSSSLENGRLPLFRNYDDFGNQIARPRTLLIDSEQLESGDALDDNFRKMAGDEIDRLANDARVLRDGRTDQIGGELQNRIGIEFGGEPLFWELDAIALNTRKLNFQGIAFRAHRLDMNGLPGWLRRRHDRFGGEIERYAEYIGIFDIEEPLFIQFVRLAAQRTTNDLHTVIGCRRHGHPTHG